ncbi:hypothetical protein BJ166DRAFT_199090 [Pestalotiopsis sp. NC0098]|nr:hypothetical protein BJ166DRAFT_199090 [Pestalotiopsis sp. NC0098]
MGHFPLASGRSPANLCAQAPRRKRFRSVRSRAVASGSCTYVLCVTFCRHQGSVQAKQIARVGGRAWRTCVCSRLQEKGPVPGDAHFDRLWLINAIPSSSPLALVCTCVSVLPTCLTPDILLCGRYNGRDGDHSGRWLWLPQVAWRPLTGYHRRGDGLVCSNRERAFAAVPLFASPRHKTCAGRTRFRHDHVLNVDAWQACSIECGNAKEDAGGSAEADLSLGMQV